MNTYNGHVIKVVDGDTFDALVELGFGVTQKFRIRLDGINTPENHTDEGVRASEFVRELIENKSVKLIEAKNKDKFGRALAKVQMEDGQDLTDYLIKEGLGYEYHGGKKIFALTLLS